MLFSTYIKINPQSPNCVDANYNLFVWTQTVFFLKEEEDDTPADEVSTSEPVTTEIEVTLKETDEEASSSATTTPPQHTIPDELELQQLAKLSSLKESDA